MPPPPFLCLQGGIVFHSRFKTLRPFVGPPARPSARGILINAAVTRQLRNHIIAVPPGIIFLRL